MFLFKKRHFLKIASKVAKYLGHFCNKICCQDLSKIAQSWHTEFKHNLNVFEVVFVKIKLTQMLLCRQNLCSEYNSLLNLTFNKSLHYHLKVPTYLCVKSSKSTK